MTTDEILAFLRTRGSSVVSAGGGCWYNDYQQTQVYQSFPIHRLITPTRDELRAVFAKARGAKAVRFLSPVESKGHQSFIWIRRAPYELDDLSANTRSRVRRGLKRCVIRSIRFEELAALGWDAHRDTAGRHGEVEPSSLGIDAVLDECPAYEAWAAFVGETLAAFVVTMSVDGWAYVLVSRSVDAFLSSYANNALVFSVVKELLTRPDIDVVSYGLEGLVPVSSLDRFKASMGFVKQPVRQRIVLAPLLRPLLNPLTSAPISALAGLMRNNLRVQKLAGFCRVASQS
jgi:hypothetical protein